MSPSTKDSTFSLSNFPIRDSKGEKMPIGESGGLYQVTITKGFEFGLWISKQRFSNASICRSFRTVKLIEVFT